MTIKVIKVVETRITYYTPDLTESDFYVEHDAQTIEDAMKLDRDDLLEGKITIDEIANRPPDSINYEFSIVEVPDGVL